MQISLFFFQEQSSWDVVFRAQSTSPFQKSSRWWTSVAKVSLEPGITSCQLASASTVVLRVHSKVPWNAASACPSGGKGEPLGAQNGVTVARQQGSSGEPGPGGKSCTDCRERLLGWGCPRRVPHVVGGQKHMGCSCQSCSTRQSGQTHCHPLRQGSWGGGPCGPWLRSDGALLTQR